MSESVAPDNQNVSHVPEDDWCLFVEWVMAHIPPMINIKSAIILNDRFPWTPVKLMGGILDGTKLGMIPPINFSPTEEWIHWTNYSSLKEAPEELDFILILSRESLSDTAKERLTEGRSKKKGAFWLVVIPYDPKVPLPNRYTNPYLQRMYKEHMPDADGKEYCIWSFYST